MVCHRDAKRPGVFERCAHQLRAHDRLAVVAHGHGTRADHLTELGERLAHLADRDGADGIHARAAGALGLTDDEADGRLIVRHGIGVGHGADGRESPRGGRTRAGGDGFDLLASRLPEMTVHVDEPRRDDASFAFHDVQRVAVAADVPDAPTGLDESIDDEQVSHRVDALRGIDEPASAQQQCARTHRVPPRGLPPPFAASASSGFPPASRYSTAMRTATPFVT